MSQAMYYLPAPGQSAFVMPESDIFYVPDNPRVWTEDMTQQLRAQERELMLEWAWENAWVDNCIRMRRKACKTPDVMIAPGYALPAQLSLWAAA